MSYVILKELAKYTTSKNSFWMLTYKRSQNLFIQINAEACSSKKELQQREGLLILRLNGCYLPNRIAIHLGRRLIYKVCSLAFHRTFSI